jgi:hypothetical protein
MVAGMDATLPAEVLSPAMVAALGPRRLTSMARRGKLRS